MTATASYDGNVSVGGAAQTRELPGLSVTKVAVGGFDNNAYFLRCPRTGDVVLVDAAAEPDRLLAELDRLGGRLTVVVTTHQHGDHWQALAAVVDATGAEVAAHPLDAGGLPVQVGRRLSDGDRVRVGAAELEAIHLAGHTPGGIALLYDAGGELRAEPHLFTGDSLFPGGVGRTTPETFPQLFADVTSKLFDRLPDETWVYPGHGRDTTLGTERPHLAEWRERGW